MSEMKLYRAILHTGNKTEDRIRERFSEATPEDIDLFRHQQEAFDGLECMVMELDGAYSFGGSLTDESLAREKEAAWLMEQDPMIGVYCGDREGFDNDWDSGQYDPGGMWVFPAEDVEILEELKQEEDGNA